MKRRHHGLEIWQEAVDLVVTIYALTSAFPHEERYGLTSQMRRSAGSVPANIAEGAARQTSKEFAHFLYIARGSLVELETHLLVARRVGLSSANPELDEQIDCLFAKLNNFIARLKSRKEV